MKTIILASGSPRRRELLAQIGIDFTIDVADVDEDIEADDPQSLVEELSRRKAKAVAARHPGTVVLGADTVVVCDDRVLGKPKDEDDALRMLTMLSGRTHQVLTGVSLVRGADGREEERTFAECTDVVMYENGEDVLRSYIATGEPTDKAGAYGIQGRGAVLVKEIHGDYNNVVGLPVARVARELSAF